MRKREWFIPVVLSIVLIGGITGGVMVAADDGSGDIDQQNQLADRHQELLARACAIYQENTGTAIDSEQFKAALDQAQGELREEALESKLQTLVEDGKLTQEEADDYLEWWQSRPDIEVPLPGLGGPAPRVGMMLAKGLRL
jgi:multidrug resistance efflux pump